MKIERVGQSFRAVAGSSHMTIGTNTSKKLTALNFEPAVSLCGASTYCERELNKLLGRIAGARLPLVIAKDFIPPFKLTIVADERELRFDSKNNAFFIGQGVHDKAICSQSTFDLFFDHTLNSSLALHLKGTPVEIYPLLKEMGFRPAVERNSDYSDRQLIELVSSLHRGFLRAGSSCLEKAAPFELIVGEVESINMRSYDGLFQAHGKFKWIKANDIPIIGYNFNLTAHVADAQKDIKNTNGETIIAVSQTVKALDVEASLGQLFENMGSFVFIVDTFLDLIARNADGFSV